MHLFPTVGKFGNPTSFLTGLGNDKKIGRSNSRRRIPLSKNTLKIVIAGLTVLLFAGSYTFARGQANGSLRGQVVDYNQTPLDKAVIKLLDQDQSDPPIAVCDERGRFVLAAVPAGRYILRLETTGLDTETKDRLIVEPGAELILKIELPSPDLEQSPGPKIYFVDFSPFSTQTLIPSHQAESLPSGNSVWSLIENQDLSATTNRIDVGGLWETLPALFSARGGCSWTQNAYILNGIDATDPYWSGQPSFIPDIFSLAYVHLSNAVHPPQAISPGAYFSLIPKEGTPDFHGGVSAFYIDKNLTTSNVTESLRNEGIQDSHTFRQLTDFNLHVSGPLVGKTLLFFASLTSQAVARNLAGYDRDDRSFLNSGLVNLSYLLPKHKLTFLWTGQDVSHSSLGAGRGIPFSSTSRHKDAYHILQLSLATRAVQSHSFRFGLGAALADLSTDFQKGLEGPHKLELFSKILSGPAAFASRDRRRSMSLVFDGKSLFKNFLWSEHLLSYGFQVRFRSASSHQDIPENTHLHFLNGRPLEVLLYDGPFEHRESALQAHLFGQETFILPNLISLSAGFNLGWIRAQNPGSEIRWLNLSPRLSLILPLSRRRTSLIKISASRYYFDLPLNYLAFGNPDAPGGLAYRWLDANGDASFQESEKGALLRREGPLFSAIDPQIRQPYTDEYAMSLTHDFGAYWFFSLAGFYRETRDLIETVNTGVTFSDYEQVLFYDEGDDRIPGSHDDLFFTVFNQTPESLGRDFFLLTNPDGQSRISRYKGLDLSLVKKNGPNTVFFLSLTAMQAVGTTSPGNTEWENDDGVIGALYDNPNAAINARGRLRFDRAYTARIGGSIRAPFGTRLGVLVKYYDGQPFARKIIVTGMNQGPFFIQAHARGVSRYEYNMTVDVRLEKIVALSVGRLRIIIDAFNVFNKNLATEENEWTGPDFPLRYATEIQSPRVFRIGMNYEF